MWRVSVPTVHLLQVTAAEGVSEECIYSTSSAGYGCRRYVGWVYLQYIFRSLRLPRVCRVSVPTVHLLQFTAADVVSGECTYSTPSAGYGCRSCVGWVYCTYSTAVLYLQYSFPHAARATTCFNTNWVNVDCWCVSFWCSEKLHVTGVTAATLSQRTMRQVCILRLSEWATESVLKSINSQRDGKTLFIELKASFKILCQ
jgi:hypothetical protein